MNYFIKWQFTKENPTSFKTQVEIMRENLIPLIEDKSFQEKKFSFYITKMYYTNVRLGVLIEERNSKELQKVVSKYTSSLKLNPFDPDKPSENNGWDGSPQKTNFTFSKDSADDTEIFYTKYLEDITRIGIDLHKKDLYSAISKAAKVAFEIRPIGKLIPREVLDSYFREFSEWYKNKKDEELDTFWGNCGFDYSQGSTGGAHFYYNIVTGIDPRPSSLNALLILISSIGGKIKIPVGDSKCSETIAFIIDNTLKENDVGEKIRPL